MIFARKSSKMTPTGGARLSFEKRALPAAEMQIRQPYSSDPPASIGRAMHFLLDKRD
jgi:hypothetical protein